MKIRFPRGLEVDTDHIPSDFEALILRAFKEFTEGTSRAYMHHDKLLFIDFCAKLMHGNPDSDDAVKKLILENVEWNLDEYGALPDADTYWDLSFMEACYEQGQRSSCLYDHFTGARRTDDIIMDLLCRAIRVVINYEGEDSDTE